MPRVGPVFRDGNGVARVSPLTGRKSLVGAELALRQPRKFEELLIGDSERVAA